MVVYFGDYVIEEEIARGARGITARKSLFQPHRCVSAHRPGLKGVQRDKGEFGEEAGRPRSWESGENAEDSLAERKGEEKNQV